MSMPHTDPRVWFKCDFCGAVVVEPSKKFLKRKRYNCRHQQCMGAAKKHCGEDNGMFGRTHSDAVKARQAQRAKDTHKGVSYDTRYGRDKSDYLKSLRAEVMSKTRKGKPSWNSGRKNVFSMDTLQRISKGSSDKWKSEAYRKRYRSAMEASGKWLPIEHIDRYELYRKQCEWIAAMWDIVPSGAAKLLEHGVFHNKTNKNGIVRDHRLSRRDGFKLGIFPEIMRHPCNCQLLLNIENWIHKGPTSSIDVELLLCLVEDYAGNWIEHDAALAKVKQYRSGARHTL